LKYKPRTQSIIRRLATLQEISQTHLKQAFSVILADIVFYLV